MAFRKVTSLILASLTVLATVLPVQKLAQAHTRTQAQVAELGEATCPKSPSMTEYIFYEGNRREPKGWWGANGNPLVNREETFTFCNHYGLITFEQKGVSVVVKWLIKPNKAYTINIYAGEKFFRKIRVSKVGMLDMTLPKNVAAKIDILN